MGSAGVESTRSWMQLGVVVSLSVAFVSAIDTTLQNFASAYKVYSDYEEVYEKII